MPATPPFTLRDLSGFDWFLVIVVAFSAFSAFRRGIVKVLFSLAGMAVGLLLASWNYAAVAQNLQHWITSSAAAQVVAFLAILALVTLVFTLAAGFVRKTIAAVGLGMFDRMLGAGFGIVRGALFCIALMMVMTAFVPESSWVQNSRLAPYFLAGAHAVSFVVPRRLQEQMAAGAAHLLQQRPEPIKPRTSMQSL